MSSGPFPVGLGWWGAVLLAALALGFAVLGLVRPRGLGGLFALLLAALACDAGVVVQVRAEREVERFLTTMGPAPNRAQLERMRLYRYPHAQSRGRRIAIAALLPLLLGAIAALRRPLGSRAPALGFLALALLAWAAAWHISHRPLPIDRYDFPEEDDAAWLLAIAIDDVHEGSTFGSGLGGECELVDQALRRVKPMPPALQAASAVATSQCVRTTLAALEGTKDPSVARRLGQALLESVSLKDEAVREQLARPPSPAQSALEDQRLRARERIQALLGPTASTATLEEALAHADAGVR